LNQQKSSTKNSLNNNSYSWEQNYVTISIGLTMSVELATLTGISVFVSVDFCQQKFERKITKLQICQFLNFFQKILI